MEQHECNHNEEIAKALYESYCSHLNTNFTAWDELKNSQDNDVRKMVTAWRETARNVLPIFGKHALKDLAGYAGLKSSQEGGWKKVFWRILELGAIALISFGIWGCGHHIKVDPDKTEICKDGSCVVIDRENQSISFEQKTPEAAVGKNPEVVEGK